MTETDGAAALAAVAGGSAAVASSSTDPVDETVGAGLGDPSILERSTGAVLRRDNAWLKAELQVLKHVTYMLMSHTR